MHRHTLIAIITLLGFLALDVSSNPVFALGHVYLGAQLRQPAIASAAFISKVAECTAAGEREAMLIAPTRQRRALGAVKSAANGYRT